MHLRLSYSHLWPSPAAEAGGSGRCCSILMVVVTNTVPFAVLWRPFLFVCLFCFLVSCWNGNSQLQGLVWNVPTGPSCSRYHLAHHAANCVKTPPSLGLAAVTRRIFCCFSSGSEAVAYLVCSLAPGCTGSCIGVRWLLSSLMRGPCPHQNSRGLWELRAAFGNPPLV